MIKILNESKIILKDIKINYTDNVKDSLADEYAADIGRYPYLQLGDMVIQTTDTSKIILYNDQFLPKIEVFFTDPTWQLIDRLYPLDDEIISLFIQSSSEMLRPIRMDFKITEFNIDKNDTGLNFILRGLLNVDYLYLNEKIAITDTSFGALKQLSKNSKLGFVSNINDTNDLMTWLDNSNTVLEFIQNIVEYSYKNDESFMLSYVDFYYNLVYVDIETALNEDISGVKGVSYGPNFFKNKKENVDDLFLTDHPDYTNSNKFIKEFSLVNQTTKINLDIGYKKSVSFYDKSNNVNYEFILDTISISGTDNNVVLKGNPDNDSDLYKNIKTKYMGTIDTDNVHPNYLYAYVQNKQNLKFLQKIRIKVVLSDINFALYRFQKIDLSLYKVKELNDDKPKTEKDMGDYWDEHINQRLSGEWLITSINYTFNKHKGFNQEITLVRRELGFNQEDFK